MKTIITLLFFAFSYIGFAQDEIKMPELDTDNKVYVLKFSPDPKEKKVISAYMKGTTVVDSLRFWAEGTTLLQNVMVTVISTDKDEKVKVDIVKDNWKDSKINGNTEDGLFQKSFSTSGRYGIIISSKKPNVPFHLAVWTTGEIIPDMGTLYYPASENKQNKKATATTVNNQNNSALNDAESKDNTLMYVVIGVLILIAVLLILLVFKNKETKTLVMLLSFFFCQQILVAQASFSNSGAFEAVSGLVNDADGVAEFFENAQGASEAIQDGLGSDDGDATPDVSSGGGPLLPSSCLPPNIGSMVDPPEESLRNRDPRTDGCACLDLAYRDLNRRRLNLERLRIIYAHAMKKINAGIAFGDSASGVHGVSGLAWQSQKMIILKESIPTLNKAYDDKYAEMIQALEENLRKIDECEAMLGYENWYSNAGFIYYQFMADKYKRN